MKAIVLALALAVRELRVRRFGALSPGREERTELGGA